MKWKVNSKVIVKEAVQLDIAVAELIADLREDVVQNT